MAPPALGTPTLPDLNQLGRGLWKVGPQLIGVERAQEVDVHRVNALAREDAHHLRAQGMTSRLVLDPAELEKAR
eukprot:7834161-Alexandrium_andersonii.AAC.1